MLSHISNLVHKFSYRVNGSPLISSILQIDLKDVGFWSSEEDLLAESFGVFLINQLLLLWLLFIVELCLRELLL